MFCCVRLGSVVGFCCLVGVVSVYWFYVDLVSSVKCFIIGVLVKKGLMMLCYLVKVGDLWKFMVWFFRVV